MFLNKNKLRNSLFQIVFVLICLWIVPLWSFSYKTAIFDTPTAITLEKGEYHLDGFLYDKGGVLFKFNVGINTFINLGGTEYIDRLIGSKSPIAHIPNISARIRFTDRPLDSFNLAIGFDSFYHGNFQPVSEKLFGAYFVYTQGFTMLDKPQLFSVGIRQPLLYDIIEPDLFASVYLNLFEYFNVAIEINSIHFVKQYDYHFILNQVLIFLPVQEMGIAFNIQMGLTNEEYPERRSRAVFTKGLRIYYQSFF